MWFRWHRILAATAYAAGLSLGAIATPATASCGRHTKVEIQELAIVPPRSLGPGEAFAVVVETGDLAEGSILIVINVNGDIVGSVAGSTLVPGPQEHAIAIIKTLEGGALTLRVGVRPAGSGQLRQPRDNEFLSLKLIPMEVSP